MADNIAIRVALEGSPEVQEKLRQIGRAGEEMTAALQQATAGGLGQGLGNLGNQADALGGKVTRGAAIINGFKSTLASIRPVAASAGASIGALGSFAEAGRAGIIGLGAAIAAGLLVALARIADQATIAKERLSELLGSKAQGTNAFKELDQDAKKLGTDVNNLVPAFEELIKAQQKLRPLEISPVKSETFDPFGNKVLQDVQRLTPGLEEARRAVTGLSAALKQGGADGETAGKALQQFFKAVTDQGKLTEDALKSLQQASPRAANAIAQGLGRANAGELLNDLARGVTKTAEEVVRSAGRISGSLVKEFEKGKEQSRTFQSALEELGASLKRIGNDAGVGSAATSAVDTLRKGFESMALTAGAAINAIKSAFGALWPAVEAGARAFVDHNKFVFQSLVSDISNVALSIGSALSSAFETIRSVVTTVIESVSSAFQSLVSGATSVGQSIGQALTSGLDAARNATIFVVDGIKSAFQTLVSDVSNIGQSIGAAVVQGFETARQAILGIIESIKAAWESIKGSLPSFGNPGNLQDLGNPSGDSFDRGGFTGAGGRLEPAGIVHRGEYVEPMHVVRQPGVLAFLETLRRFGGDLQRTIAAFQGQGVRLRRFSVGGLVTGMEHALASLPGYAAGGLVEQAAFPASAGGLHPVILQLPDGQKIGGLSVKASLLDQLERDLRLKALFKSR